MKKIMCGVVLLSSLALMAAKGCTQQSVVVALIDSVGATAAILAKTEGNPAGAQKITTAYQAAAQVAANWQTGTDASAVIADVNAIQTAVLSVFDINGPDAINVQAILNGIEGIIESLPASTTAVATPAFTATRAKAATVPAPKTAAEFKAQWNAALLAHPVKGLKPL